MSREWLIIPIHLIAKLILILRLKLRVRKQASILSLVYFVFARGGGGLNSVGRGVTKTLV